LPNGYPTQETALKVQTEMDYQRAAKRLPDGHKVYAPGAKGKTRAFQAPNTDWKGEQPRGLEYWKVAHQAIQLNPVNERDKFMMQGLKNLGIEKGKPFELTEYQKEILKQATLVGETMASAYTYEAITVTVGSIGTRLGPLEFD
jgi:hypothetical protein